MTRPLRVVTFDVSQVATAIAATHDPRGDAFLHTFTIPGTVGRPLHEQCATIEYVARRSCGYSQGDGMLWRPDVVTFEGTFSAQTGSDYPLHHLHANLKQWLWRRRIPYVDVAPSTLKVWMCGKGRGATKRETTACVIADYGRHLSINPADDNQADAVGLLTMTLAAYGQPLGDLPPVKQRRALKGLERSWPSVDLAAS